VLADVRSDEEEENSPITDQSWVPKDFGVEVHRPALLTAAPRLR
jgi:hypothetical protein